MMEWERPLPRSKWQRRILLALWCSFVGVLHVLALVWRGYDKLRRAIMV
jgi:hypothetical protein